MGGEWVSASSLRSAIVSAWEKNLIVQWHNLQAAMIGMAAPSWLAQLGLDHTGLLSCPPSFSCWLCGPGHQGGTAKFTQVSLYNLFILKLDTQHMPAVVELSAEP